MLKKLLMDESGQGMVEYGLIIAVVALIVVGAIATMGGGLSAKFGEINQKLGVGGASSGG